jgi:glycosyltransferase involved in cell wall biosynthesis
VAPEARWAFPHHRSALPALARRFRVLGHGHPRVFARLSSAYRSVGIEPVEAFDDVLRRADLYVCDNSSTLFEFAATGRPVVVLDAPWYRRDVVHGLRFWEAADIGIRVGDPMQLVDAVIDALADPPGRRAERERIIATIYARPAGGAARAAADAIAAWLTGAAIGRAA